jgi:hypothetical protein
MSGIVADARRENTWHSAARSTYRAGMPPPHGFAFTVRGASVVITHHGARATVLRGRRASAFLDDVARADPQELMARVTGSYRRGNERVARQHPRNARRLS